MGISEAISLQVMYEPQVEIDALGSKLSAAMTKAFDRQRIRRRTRYAPEMPFVSEPTGPRRFERSTWLVVHPRGLVARQEEGRLIFPTDADLALLGVGIEDAHRLGALDETDVFAVPFAKDVDAPFRTIGLRALAGLLEPELFGMVGRAMHTCDWLTTTRFCGRCGTAMGIREKERSRVCPSCELHSYPRISPAIITLVRKGDQALLASSARYPGAFYTTLAGFAEIGESLEETLVREVREEVGVDVTNLRYFGSQPWPFPNSLMIAFTADWRAGEIRIDPEEIADARWFSATDLPVIPPPLSIARHLIDAWVREVTGAK